VEARALRFVAPRRVEIQRVEVRPPAPGEVLVRTRWSGISGGTELLAYRGELDETLELDETIGSLEGTFRYPFAYGYSSVGEVDRSGSDGPGEGSTVFAFHPHQDLFTAPAADVVAVEGVDGRVATLFPLVETALQVALDAGPRVEEPVVVLGLGPVGVLTGAMLQRSGADVLAADPRRDRRETASRFGIRVVDSSEIREAVLASTSGSGVPLVVDATGNPAALPLALELLAHEGEALVCSWFGSKDVRLPLGAAFHRRRLTIKSTQVSTIPARLAGRWDIARRRRAAMRLLTELPVKLLATHDLPFEQAAEAYAALDRGDEGVMHVALRF
jgi:2-desacetyl-2-hydroxyethyl bacteriochlorophyllide A dehydrogenase